MILAYRKSRNTLMAMLLVTAVLTALILLLTPDNLGSPTASPWQFGVSLLLFAFTVVGVRRYRFHPAFMLALCALAGRLLL